MKILFFYPENPLLKTQGNNARAYALLEYFKSRAITIDLVGQQQHHSGLFSQEHIEQLKSKQLINEGWILKRTKHSGLTYFFYSLGQKLTLLFNAKVKDFNRLRMHQKEAFLSIFKASKYDYVIVSYVYNYPLIAHVDLGDTTKVIDTHDFLTSQFKGNKKFKLGKYFQEEMRILNQFDAVWAISIEEQYLFSQFVSSKVALIPHNQANHLNTGNLTKTIDLFYVASENVHNIKSAQWFFKTVYPLLKKNINIVVVGKINAHIPEFKNVKKVDYEVDLKAFYSDSKIVICPMLSGTGLKIKVVEALSYGIPVVCNTRGVDGLLNKASNGCLVTDNSDEMANYINKLLEDKAFYEQTKTEAQNFFLETLEKDKVYNTLDRFFNIK